MKFIESKTAYKVGWGSDRYRRVSGLTKEERKAVRAGDAVVWFRIDAYHYTQSGYKIVTPGYGYNMDSREPTDEELKTLLEVK